MNYFIINEWFIIRSLILKQCDESNVLFMNMSLSPFFRIGPWLSSPVRTCPSRGSAGTRTGVWGCVCDGASSPPDASREPLPDPPQPVRTRRPPWALHTRRYHGMTCSHVACRWDWAARADHPHWLESSRVWAGRCSMGVSLTVSTALALVHRQGGRV